MSARDAATDAAAATPGDDAALAAARARLDAWRRALARREASIALGLGLAPLAAAAALALRLGGLAAALAMAALGALALGAWARRAAATITLAGLARRLDARERALEDSSALLLPGAAPRGLALRQRARVAARLRPDMAPPPRPWPRARLAASMLLGGLAVAAALAWPDAPPATASAGAPSTDADDAGPRAPEATTLLDARLAITPPAYTALPPREEAGLAARVPAGSALAWTLALDSAPRAAALVLHDGRRIALERVDASPASDGDALRDASPGGVASTWRASHRADASFLYRLALDGAPPADPRLHRIDAVADRPPAVRVREPARNVVLATPGQAAWALGFEASDDHGLGAATLVLTLAQGSGEQRAFSERRQPLAGRGDARRRAYATTLDLAALGVGPGDDVVARLEVLDGRRPTPQRGESPSVVLRWPAPPAGAAGDLEGLAQRVLPAAFRSQRQIILDAEALVAARPALAPAAFAARADGLGADQAALRLRYGQFLGEEAEAGVPGGAPASDDAPAAPPRPANLLFADENVAGAAPVEAAPDADARAAAADAGQADAPALPPGHAHDDGHDHGDVPGPEAGLGGGRDALMADYGHLHDLEEAATLLDPATRELLRTALGAMWASERALRQAEPEAALPHARRALAFIKQVQEADRIYLPRMGMELPPIDLSRRLGGRLDGARDRADPIAPTRPAGEALARLWRALEAAPAGDAQAAALADALEDALAWALAEAASAQAVPVDAAVADDDDAPAGAVDALGLVAAIDAVQRAPDDADAREALRAALWPRLPLPAAGVRPREAVDAAGAAYLEALQAPPAGAPDR